MKYLLSFSCTCLLLFILISFLPVNGEEKVYDNMIRLHVLANSDSQEDQMIKLKVRDRILDEIEEEVSGVSSYDEAYTLISSILPKLEDEANQTLEEYTTAAQAKVTIGEELYPERIYEDFTLPSGKYMSLRVIIGEGEGKNWWCVLFPPLCTSAAKGEQDFIEAGISSEGYRMIKNESAPKYKVRFKVLEILSEVFGYKY